eukprot:1186837-Prorocentrum_minimum.AAC.6
MASFTGHGRGLSSGQNDTFVVTQVAYCLVVAFEIPRDGVREALFALALLAQNLLCRGELVLDSNPLHDRLLKLLNVRFGLCWSHATVAHNDVGDDVFDLEAVRLLGNFHTGQIESRHRTVEPAWILARINDRVFAGGFDVHPDALACLGRQRALCRKYFRDLVVGHLERVRRGGCELNRGGVLWASDVRGVRGAALEPLDREKVQTHVGIGNCVLCVELHDGNPRAPSTPPNGRPNVGVPSLLR